MGTDRQQKWRDSMIARYGSWEEVQVEMRRRQQKSRENPSTQKGSHRGGFKVMQENDPDRLSRISKDAARKRHETIE